MPPVSLTVDLRKTELCVYRNDRASGYGWNGGLTVDGLRRVASRPQAALLESFPIALFPKRERIAVLSLHSRSVPLVKAIVATLGAGRPFALQGNYQLRPCN